MARSGRFGGGLTPFGGGTLNIDAVYQIGEIRPTASPPPPGEPPPVDYGGWPPQQSVPESPDIPVVGTTPIPPGVVAQPATLPQWAPKPMTLSEYNAKIRANVIARAQQAGITYNTATVNKTVANDYAKYLASLGG